MMLYNQLQSSVGAPQKLDHRFPDYFSRVEGLRISRLRIVVAITHRVTAALGHSVSTLQVFQITFLFSLASGPTVLFLFRGELLVTRSIKITLTANSSTSSGTHSQSHTGCTPIVTSTSSSTALFLSCCFTCAGRHVLRTRQGRTNRRSCTRRCDTTGASWASISVS